MRFKTLLLAAAAPLSIVAPASAFAQATTDVTAPITEANGRGE